MLVAFYKGKGLVSNIIKFWTRSNYSHCELVFNNGASYSADTKMPMHTRFSTQTMLSEEWDFINLQITCDDEREIEDFCLEELGCSYDWKGILLSQFINFGYHSKTKWFCSEVCVGALQHIGLFPGIKPNRVSPGKLYELVKKMAQR